MPDPAVHPFDAAVEALNEIGESGPWRGWLGEWCEAKDVELDDLATAAGRIAGSRARLVSVGLLDSPEALQGALLLALVAGYTAAETRQGAAALGGP